MSGSLTSAAAFSLYRLAGRLGSPLVRRHLRRRVAGGREDATRLVERFGEATAERPDGPLVWLHAASVGESLSALPLLERIRSDWPKVNLLMTSGTVTSAKLMAERLPGGVIHQYVPVDLGAAVRRFLDHWRPTVGLIVESELWPNLLMEAKQRRCKLLLVNGRMSGASARTWRRFPSVIQLLLGQFDEVFAQSPEDLSRFQALGAQQARYLGNLKFAALPLTAESRTLAALTAKLGDRPLWLAASTHPGEESVVAAADRAIRETLPGLLTIIVPRHPDRGGAISESLAADGARIALRSLSEPLDETTEIYVADTLGELGLWFRLAPVVFVGGSLVPIGGHNPLEPAKLGSAILCGPHTANFLRVCNEMESAGALRRVADSKSLAEAVSSLLRDNNARHKSINAARSYAETQASVLDEVMTALTPYLNRVEADK